MLLIPDKFVQELMRWKRKALFFFPLRMHIQHPVKDLRGSFFPFFLTTESDLLNLLLLLFTFLLFYPMSHSIFKDNSFFQILKKIYLHFYKANSCQTYFGKTYFNLFWLILTYFGKIRPTISCNPLITWYWKKVLYAIKLSKDQKFSRATITWLIR